MKRSFLRVLLAIGLLPIWGCDMDRMNRLEKQNQELKTEIEKNRTATEYDLQQKCAKDSKIWFNENWPPGKDTILLNYTNHYNKSSNKCFILVEYHYHTDKNGSWVNHQSMWDLYENSQYADFAENTNIFSNPYRIGEEVITCELFGKKCEPSDQSQFNKLVSPYMNN